MALGLCAFRIGRIGALVGVTAPDLLPLATSVMIGCYMPSWLRGDLAWEAAQVRQGAGGPRLVRQRGGGGKSHEPARGCAAQRAGRKVPRDTYMCLVRT